MGKVGKLFQACWALAGAIWFAGGWEVQSATGDLPDYERIQEASVEVFTGRKLAGSGWVVEGENLVFSAAHVVQGADQIELRFSSSDRLPAVVVAWDRAHDLVLLQPKEDNDSGGSRMGLKLAPAVPPAGTPVYLLGSPLFRHGIMVGGMVSRPEPAFEWNPNLRTMVEVFYLSAPSPMGMSGGVWFNREGQVVGLQSGMMTMQGSPVGIAFAAGVEPMRELLRVRRTRPDPFLGAVVEELGEQEPATLQVIPEDQGGVLVRILEEGSLLAESLREGDLIQRVNGRAVERRVDYYRAVREAPEDGGILFSVYRPSERKALEVLVIRPKPSQSPGAAGAP